MQSIKAVLTFSKIATDARRFSEHTPDKKLILAAGKPIVFGRCPEATVRLGDSTMSSKHLIFSVDEELRLIHVQVLGQNGAWLIRDGTETHVRKEELVCSNGDSWYIRGLHGLSFRIHIAMSSMNGGYEVAEHIVEEIVSCEEKIRAVDRENTTLYSKLLVFSQEQNALEDGSVVVRKTDEDEKLEKLYERVAFLEKEIAQRRAEGESEFATMSKETLSRANDILEANKRMRAKSDEMDFKRRKLMEVIDPRKSIADAEHPMQDRGKPLPYDDMVRMENLAASPATEPLALEASADEPRETDNEMLDDLFATTTFSV